MTKREIWKGEADLGSKGRKKKGKDSGYIIKPTKPTTKFRGVARISPGNRKAEPGGRQVLHNWGRMSKVRSKKKRGAISKQREGPKASKKH